MIIKVCGIKIQQNLDDLAESPIQMVGYNFYEKSKRFLGDKLELSDADITKVGVFVNADKEMIKTIVVEHNLDYAQLHGDESADFCRGIRAFTKVIKVFRVDTDFDFESTKDFEFCDLFLFDTYTAQYGGSGKTFDWKALAGYTRETAFLLSGGIGPTSVNALQDFHHPRCIGIDINSKFEISPGHKDVELIQSFVRELNLNQDN